MRPCRRSIHRTLPRVRTKSTNPRSASGRKERSRRRVKESQGHDSRRSHRPIRPIPLLLHRGVDRASSFRIRRSDRAAAQDAAIPVAVCHRSAHTRPRNAAREARRLCAHSGESGRGRPGGSRKWRTPSPKPPPQTNVHGYSAPAGCVFRNLHEPGASAVLVPRTAAPTTIRGYVSGRAALRAAEASSS